MKFIMTVLIALVPSLAAAQSFQSNGSWGGFSSGFGGGGFNGGASVSHRGNDYGGADARRVQRVSLGIVEDLRMVEITSKNSAGQLVGAGIGGALGALAGRQVGRDAGRDAAAIALGALGAFAGHAVGDRVSTVSRRSLEIVIQLDDGRMVVVTQEIDADSAELRPGDKVRLVEGSVTRVVRIRSAARTLM